MREFGIICAFISLVISLAVAIPSASPRFSTNITSTSKAISASRYSNTGNLPIASTALPKYGENATITSMAGTASGYPSTGTQTNASMCAVEQHGLAPIGDGPPGPADYSTACSCNAIVSSVVTVAPTVVVGMNSDGSLWSETETVSTVTNPAYTPPTDCCVECLVTAADVQILYWPVETATPNNLSTANNLSITAAPPVATPFSYVENGMTFISPSVYVAYRSLGAANNCPAFGPKYFGQGNATDITIGYAPDALSTSMCDGPPAGFQLYTAINYTELQYPTGAQTQGTCEWRIGSSGTPRGPYLSIPTGIQDVNPAWSSCKGAFEGSFDPPSALRKASAMVAPTPTPAPAKGPSATPGPSITSANPPPTATPAPVDPGSGDPGSGDPGSGNSGSGNPGIGSSGNGDPASPPAGSNNGNPPPSVGGSNPAPNQNGASGSSDPPTNPNLNPGTGSASGSGSSSGSGTGSGSGSPGSGSPGSGSPGSGSPGSGSPGSGSPGSGSPGSGSSGSGSSSGAGSGTGSNTGSNTGAGSGAGSGSGSSSGSNAGSGTGPNVGSNAGSNAGSGSGSGSGANPGSGNAPVAGVGAGSGTVANPQPPPNTVIVSDGTTITRAPNGGAIIGTSTIPLGSTALIANTPLSVGTDHINYGSTSYALPAATTAGAVLVGSSPLVKASNGGVVIGGSTIGAGVQTAVSGHTISIGASQAVVDGSTYALPASAGGVVQAAATASPVLIGGQSIIKAANGGIVIGDSTVSPGAQTTISGHAISVGSSVAVIDGTSYALPTAAGGVLQQSPNLAQNLASNSKITLANGAIITAGGAAATVDGTVIAIPSDDSAFIVNGKTVPLPTPTPTSNSVFTIAGQTFTAAPTGFTIGSQTLLPNGPALTLSGTIISLGPSGLQIGSSTIPLPTPTPINSIFTIGSQTITAAPSGFAIGTQTLLPGGSAVTISGTVLSLGAGGLVIGTSTVPLTPAEETADADAGGGLGGLIMGGYGAGPTGGAGGSNGSLGGVVGFTGGAGRVGMGGGVRRLVMGVMLGIEIMGCLL